MTDHESKLCERCGAGDVCCLGVCDECLRLAEERESRKRIAELQSAITDAIGDIIHKFDREGLTYGELFCAMSQVMARWAGRNWAEDIRRAASEEARLARASSSDSRDP